MKTKRINQILVVLLLVFTVGCLEDPKPTPLLYNTWGFFKTIGSDNFVNADGGAILKIKEFSNEKDIEGIEENDRVILNFNIEETSETGSEYDNLIKVRNIVKVNYDTITIVNEYSRDTLGNGFVRLGERISIDKYLNLEIFFNPTKQKHSFTLSYDEEMQEDSKPVILDLRNYYPEGETPDMESYVTYQSYNLQHLMAFTEPNKDNEYEFILRINNGTSSEQDYELKMKPL